MEEKANAILLLSCRDQKGIVASISNFIYQNDGNIVYADQHTDQQEQLFFMRIEWELKDFQIPREEIKSAFLPLAEKFQMSWELHFTDYIHRIAIFLSRQGHCLYDLLWRHRMGEFNAEIPLIISNHEDQRKVAEQFGIDYFVFPKTAENKKLQESRELELLKARKIDLIVLARYMQTLSPDFIAQYPNKIINIHHSFLPAFVGEKPYHQAYQRGVKIIGATSHYATAELDQGPIIEQDIVRISHRDSVEDLIRKGRDLEKIVLARAVSWHLEHRVLVYANKTVVFT